MVGHCSTHGENKKCTLNGCWKACRKQSLGKRRKWKNNIEIDLKDTELEGVNWINLAREGAQRLTFMNKVMNFLVPYQAGNIVTS
jgi:hypothetical protein